MLKAILISPKFLYRIEQDNTAPTEANGARPVADMELASRLSYFIWSSMPDSELMEQAAAHRLTAPGPSQAPAKLSGTPIGQIRVGDNGHLPERAFDSDPYTFYEGGVQDQSWVGLDLHEPRTIRLVKYAARYGEEKRLVDGKIQGSSTADFSSGVVDLLTIAAAPAPSSIVTAAISGHEKEKYQFVRFVGPKWTWGNIAELEFWGDAPGTVLEQEVRRMLADPKARR